MTRNYSIVGVIPSGYGREVERAAQDELLAHRARGGLRVPLEPPVPFDALPDGLERLARREVLGKLVLRVG